MSRRRRWAFALVASGLSCLAGGVAAWQATPAGAVELFSFELHAGSRGVQVFSGPFKDAGIGDPGGGIGITEASLVSGPVGHGLSTVAWPGPLAANGGTLVLVLQPGCGVTAPAGIPNGTTPLCPIPDEAANQANTPFRAEARSGQEVPTAVNDQAPGIHLESTALKDKVTADAIVAKAAGAIGNLGKISAHSETLTTDDGGVAKGVTTIQNVSLGGGAVTIDSVVSTATAHTDGSTADGAGTTKITGLTIGGQPATLDETGLHIGESNSEPNAVANQIAQQALSGAGIELILGVPTREVNGSAAVVGAPPLVISWTPEGQTPTAVVFGGATAAVTGAPGDSSLLEDLSDTGSFDTGGFSDVGTGSLDFGSSPSADGGAPSAAGPGDVAIGPLQNAVSGGKPVKPGAVVLGVLGAGFLALGLRRLSQDVLAERNAITCSLEADQ